jgi:hypothetical protein
VALLVREPHRCTLTVACISGILISKWFGDALGIRKSWQTRRVNRSRQATQRFGIGEGSMVIAEAREDGILIRPAVIVPVERCSPERKTEFLLSVLHKNW